MATSDIIAELAKRNEELEREVARLRGVIEGMGKRPASPFPAWAAHGDAESGDSRKPYTRPTLRRLPPEA